MLNIQKIALFDVRGQLYAIDNYAAISKANVLSSGIISSIKGELCVAAPIYKQHFSLLTGQRLEDPAIAVSTYAVRLNNDSAEINIQDISNAA